MHTIDSSSGWYFISIRFLYTDRYCMVYIVLPQGYNIYRSLLENVGHEDRFTLFNNNTFDGTLGDLREGCTFKVCSDRILLIDHITGRKGSGYQPEG